MGGLRTHAHICGKIMQIIHYHYSMHFIRRMGKSKELGEDLKRRSVDFHTFMVFFLSSWRGV